MKLCAKLLISAYTNKLILLLLFLPVCRSLIGGSGRNDTVCCQKNMKKIDLLKLLWIGFEVVMVFEKHVLKHKNSGKSLEGNEKVPNFALAFEDERLQRQPRRESEKKWEATEVKRC